jgi:hypothetical protein
MRCLQVRLGRQKVIFFCLWALLLDSKIEKKEVGLQEAVAAARLRAPVTRNQLILQPEVVMATAAP